MKGKLCNFKNSDCKELLDNFPFEVTELPFMFTVNFNKINDQPIIHTYKDEFEVDKMKQFFKNLKKNRIKYDVFSEKIEETHEPYSNTGVR